MDSTLRPMSTSQILDRTFYLYRKNLLLFMGIALVAPALSLVSRLVLLAIFGQPVIPQPGNFDPAIWQGLIVQAVVGTIVGVIVYAIGNALASSATIHAVSMVHLGKTTTIQESYAKIKPIFWRVLRIVFTICFFAFAPFVLAYGLIIAAGLGAILLLKGGGNSGVALGLVALIVGLVGLAGICASVVWWVYAWCRYALAVPASTLENLPARQALIRSRLLSKGSRGRIFAVFFLTGLMTVVLTYVLQAPALIANNMLVMNAQTRFSMASLLWIYLAEFFAVTFAGPIATIAIALLYYDERIRREAFDLQLMMEALGQTTAAQPGPTQAATAGPPGIA